MTDDARRERDARRDREDPFWRVPSDSIWVERRPSTHSKGWYWKVTARFLIDASETKLPHHVPAVRVTSRTVPCTLYLGVRRFLATFKRIRDSGTRATRRRSDP